MSKKVTTIIIAIVIVINVVLITATTISIGSAVKRQLSNESEALVSADTSSSTIIKEIFNSDNFVAIIKTIEGVNLIVFGVLIAVKSRKY